jgi:hypothetical protein
MDINDYSLVLLFAAVENIEEEVWKSELLSVSK